MARNKKVFVEHNGVVYLFFKADQLWYPVGGDEVLFCPANKELSKHLKDTAISNGYEEECFLPPPPPPAHLIEQRNKREQKAGKVEKPKSKKKKEVKEKKPSGRTSKKLSVKLFE